MEPDVALPKDYFDNEVNSKLDFVSRTISSPEFAEFEKVVESKLSHIKDQGFLIDIEDTFMKDVSDEKTRRTVYYYNPYMMAVINSLIENGNSVVFYTSATRELTQKMQAGMPQGIDTLKIIAREDYEEEVKKRNIPMVHNGVMDDPQYFLRMTKHPEFFMDPQISFFIDNNRDLVDMAVKFGWPEERAIKCDDQFTKESSLEVIKKISKVIKK